MQVVKPRAPAPRGDGVITSLVATRGRSDRVSVRINGAKAFDLAVAVLEQAGLHVGDSLSEEAQDGLLAKDAPFRARDRALGFLTLRDRSRVEVETRLKATGFGPEIVFDTVSWLLGLGYLDDKRFASRYYAEKLKVGWGPRRVRSELLRKGVARALVEEALGSESEGAEAAEGLEAVTALARRRFGEQFARDPVAAGRRLAGFLARRGYDWDTSAAVARILASEAGGGDSMFDPEASGD